MSSTNSGEAPPMTPDAVAEIAAARAATEVRADLRWLAALAMTAVSVLTTIAVGVGVWVVDKQAELERGSAR